MIEKENELEYFDINELQNIMKEYLKRVKHHPNHSELHTIKAGDQSKTITTIGLTYLVKHMTSLAEDILEIATNENIIGGPVELIDAYHIYYANNLARGDLTDIRERINREERGN
jgi:hypothetical protein